jgi:hypothetical protein
MEIAEFLLARIAEDEALVEKARERNLPFWGDQLTARYVDRFSPARVLTECEAKRRIVELCNVDELVLGSSPWWTRWPVLQALALPYSDHPDYRAEWMP